MKDVTVSLAASMSVEQFRDFLQTVRDFDMKHDSEIEFEIVSGSPDISAEEMAEIFAGVNPPMPYCRRFDFKTGTFTDYPEKPAN